MFDIEKIRLDFPILSTSVNKHALVYLDSGATTQKPRVVIDAVSRLYSEQNANIHRGVHYLSERCTEGYELSREAVRRFINAAGTREVVFTAGTTAAINLVASSFGDEFIKEGDEIITTVMEHHSNFVPWQMLCKRKSAKLRVVDIDDDGQLNVEQLYSFINPRTKLIALTHISNVLGTVNPVKEIIAAAHKHNVPVLVDGAQGIVHGKVDVLDMDCDFYVFSGHKLYAPTGIGVLYAKEKWLEAMPPYQYGGDMVGTVSIEQTTFADLPLKFEAGTANYVDAIGLGAAIAYLEELGMENIRQHEHELQEHIQKAVAATDGITVHGTASEKAAILSFSLEGAHHYDVGMILDKMGIAVRTGQLCAEPLMTRLGITGLVRASFALYNTTSEVDALFKGTERVKRML